MHSQYNISMQSWIWGSKIIFWDTSTPRQVSNCDGAVLEIYLDQKFQWLQEGFNCEPLA